jgi:6-phosphogluconolactonase (cycloisomerase 2 family)
VLPRWQVGGRGEVLIDPSGRFLYSCSRGPEDDLVIYKIASDGHLVLITHTPLGGKGTS